jgi:predicted nucleic acid-binding protein
METANGFIAAIALTYGFSVATRNVLPFQAAGVTVINPWEATPA